MARFFERGVLETVVGQEFTISGKYPSFNGPLLEFPRKTFRLMRAYDADAQEMWKAAPAGTVLKTYTLRPLRQGLYEIRYRYDHGLGGEERADRYIIRVGPANTKHRSRSEKSGVLPRQPPWTYVELRPLGGLSTLAAISTILGVSSYTTLMAAGAQQNITDFTAARE